MGKEILEGNYRGVLENNNGVIDFGGENEEKDFGGES